MPSISRASTVLSSFSVSQLQSGVTISVPHKISVPHPAPGQRDYRIVAQDHHVRGTRIPASTLAKFKTGEWTPSQRTLSKLRSFSDRINYQRLRAVGASPAEAARHRRKPPGILKEILDNYIRTVLTIAANKGVSPLYVSWGCAHSWRLSEDWDSYCQEMEYKEVDVDYSEWLEGYDDEDEEEEEE